MCYKMQYESEPYIIYIYKLAPYGTDVRLLLTAKLPSSKSRDRKSRTEIKKPAR